MLSKVMLFSLMACSSSTTFSVSKKEKKKKTQRQIKQVQAPVTPFSEGPLVCAHRARQPAPPSVGCKRYIRRISGGWL